MTTRCLAALLGAALASAMPLLPVAAREPTVVMLRTTPLTIATAKGPRRFTVEQALSGGEQARGLMYRRAMPARHGMIFPMDPPRPASFWMKNTYISLDLIFIGPDRRVLNIAERAKRLDLNTIDSAGPVSAVLELNAGTAGRYGIHPGDKVDW